MLLLLRNKKEARKEEGPGKKEKEIVVVCNLFSGHYGKRKSIVTRPTPFQTVVATALSARTRDANTAKACKLLFSVYPTAKKLATATPKQVEPLIKSTGMYKTKAKNIVALAKIVSENGMSSTIEGLVQLPGVGRKTANCTMVYAFGIPAICVDTHVHRISNLLGWVSTKTPEQTERELRKILPTRYWLYINDWLVEHGQTICPARYPKCGKCFLKKHCKHGKYL